MQKKYNLICIKKFGKFRVRIIGSVLLKMNKNSLRSSIFVLEITFLGLFKWLMCEARFMAAYSKTFSVRKTAMTNLKKN